MFPGPKLMEMDVHLCVVRAGEPLYVPETVHRALGLHDGGSYALVRINDLVVIAPQGAAIGPDCAALAAAVNDSAVADLLTRIDAVRTQLAE